MPVITFDITYGTKKVKYLNVSHNSINDIRRYVLGNMTSLMHIDLSHNDLHDLTEDPYTFNLPPNVTNLYLQNNNIIKIPINKILNLTHLDVLNLENNNFEHMHPELVKLIAEGRQIQYAGNPLICDCSIRPFRHYMYSLIEPPAYHKNVLCSQPSFVAGESISDVREDYLNCDKNENRTSQFSGIEYEPLPDIRFRSIS